MAIYKTWQDLIENQTDETFKEFWEEYSAAEEKIYTEILMENTGKFSGNFGDLAKKFDIKPEIFMGFIDGIQTSLSKGKIKSLTKVTEETVIDFHIDFEQLFYNMLVADAQYLYNIPQWETVLDEKTKEEIVRKYKKSKVVVKEKTPGRNDPCSCGSGKKYKHCCGK